MRFLDHPYAQLMRLHKPIGTWLLLLPSLLGIWTAPLVMHQAVPLTLLIYTSIQFFLGAIIMRSAGCVINDFFDYKFDKKVSRTAQRPLAQGTVSPQAAFILFICLSCLGLGVLVTLPSLTILIGCLSFIPIILYPLMKRITYFPQLFLGLLYNIGIVMGFVTISNHFNAHILWLYGFGVLMTFCYDTIYAFQDIDDDQKIGVKSTAIKFQKHPKIILGALYGTAFILLSFFYQQYSMYCINFIVGFIIFYKLKGWDIKNHGQTAIYFKDHALLFCFYLVLSIILTFLKVSYI